MIINCENCFHQNVCQYKKYADDLINTLDSCAAKNIINPFYIMVTCKLYINKDNIVVDPNL